YRLGRREALDLVAQHLDAPVAARLVERVHDLAVNLLARLERLVELHLADLAAQRRLRELGDGGNIVRGAVGGETRLGDLVIEDAVDAELRIVLGNAHLLRHVERYLLERVHVGDLVEERDDEIEPRLERALVAAQALDYP